MTDAASRALRSQVEQFNALRNSYPKTKEERLQLLSPKNEYLAQRADFLLNFDLSEIGADLYWPKKPTAGGGFRDPKPVLCFLDKDGMPLTAKDLSPELQELGAASYDSISLRTPLCTGGDMSDVRVMGHYHAPDSEEFKKASDARRKVFAATPRDARSTLNISSTAVKGQEPTATGQDPHALMTVAMGAHCFHAGAAVMAANMHNMPRAAAELTVHIKTKCPQAVEGDEAIDKMLEDFVRSPPEEKYTVLEPYSPPDYSECGEEPTTVAEHKVWTAKRAQIAEKHEAAQQGKALTMPPSAFYLFFIAQQRAVHLATKKAPDGGKVRVPVPNTEYIRARRMVFGTPWNPLTPEARAAVAKDPSVLGGNEVVQAVVLGSPLAEDLAKHPDPAKREGKYIAANAARTFKPLPMRRLRKGTPEVPLPKRELQLEPVVSTVVRFAVSYRDKPDPALDDRYEMRGLYVDYFGHKWAPDEVTEEQLAAVDAAMDDTGLDSDSDDGDDDDDAQMIAALTQAEAAHAGEKRKAPASPASQETVPIERSDDDDDGLEAEVEDEPPATQAEEPEPKRFRLKVTPAGEEA